MAKLTIDFTGGDVLAATMADEAERIADMIRDGFTSGQLGEGYSGWWTFEGEMEEEREEEED